MVLALPKRKRRDSAEHEEQRGSTSANPIELDLTQLESEVAQTPSKRIKVTDLLNTMADVEMTDAPKTKSSKVGPSGGDGENKPRFEVKKVC